jgi:DNA-binding response OmpR family regulator
MKPQPTILVIEDDQDINSYIQSILSDAHFIVYGALTGTKALKTLEKVVPDMVILDLNLPDVQGENLKMTIKNDYPHIPILILTAKDNPADVARNLNEGADDYMTKPFDAEELVARVKARLRKDNKADIEYRVDNLVLNTDTFTVTRGDRSIELTQTEFHLLHYLLMNKNRVLTREMILSHVWAYSPDTETRVVDVYIGYLRKKIDRGEKHKIITSMRGFGYTIKDN